MKQKVVIFGTGTTADVTHYYLRHDSPFEVVGFAVDEAHVAAPTHLGLPVFAFERLEASLPPSEVAMLVAISYVKINLARARVYERAKAKGYALVNYVSSRCTTWPDLVIGDNCNIHEGCVIEPFARIGSDVVMASCTTISHHSTIGDHCFIASNVVICGNSTIEPFCFIGANATIRDGIRIGKGCIIGAGSLVLEDTREHAVYGGRPAILLPRQSQQLDRI